MNKKELIKKGIELFDKHFPEDKYTIEAEKTSLVKFFIELHELKENKLKKQIEEIETKNYENDLNLMKGNN